MNTENETLVATQLAQQLEEKKENAALVDFKMVTFSLADKDYSIDIMHVKEIAKAGRCTFVPNTLPFVLGVYNLRGEIIPILDLRIFFNIEVPERTDNRLENMLILSVGEQTFGVVVDKIDKVVGVQRSKIQPPHPLFGDINIKYISGVVEANHRLYILLDIDRIFNSRIDEKNKEQKAVKQVFTQSIMTDPLPSATRVPAAKTAAPAQKAEGPKQDSSEKDYKFVIESLANYRKFSVSPLNERWVHQRFGEWIKERGEGHIQLQNEADADAFLKPFWSSCAGTWWNQQYAESVYKMLPENSAKQICVWNPGCGKGMESYSIACLLHKRYPSARIRIYAQDIDLLNVSNAPLLSVDRKSTRLN